MIASDVLQIRFSISDEASNLDALMSKYTDLPMSLADACLVRMSETINNSVVLTVDSDFLIYRKQGRKKIPLISRSLKST
jgi:predicted nucleic acid-binding protein